MSTLSLGMPRIHRDPTSAPDTTGRPDTPGLVDTFGRVARDLRISVTEKCSLRCTYCMPAEGLPSVPKADLLTPVEIARLVGIAGRELGIHEVRFTGGEPLTRADLVEIIALSSAASPGMPMSMTTNEPSGLRLSIAESNARRPSCSPVMISTSNPSSACSRAMNASPLLASRIAAVATARTWVTS
jgi:molybdenum cofactor biosynthesis enzyme MoaA